MEPGIEKAVEEVRRAILNPGINPEYHYEVMLAQRRAWPTLWRALDNLLNAMAKPAS